MLIEIVINTPDDEVTLEAQHPERLTITLFRDGHGMALTVSPEPPSFDHLDWLQPSVLRQGLRSLDPGREWDILPHALSPSGSIKSLGVRKVGSSSNAGAPFQAFRVCTDWQIFSFLLPGRGPATGAGVVSHPGTLGRAAGFDSFAAVLP